MNIAIGNESEEENEEEGNIIQEMEGYGEVLNQAKEKIFRAISKLGKRPKVDVDMFQEI